MQIFLGFLAKFFSDIFTGVITDALKTPAEEIEIDDTGGVLDFEPDDDLEFVKLL